MSQPDLRVITGGRACSHSYCGVHIMLDDRQPPGFQPDVSVIEEDTFRVLSAPAELRHEVIDEPFEVLVERMAEVRTTPVGSVIERPGPPLEFLAVVYDFDAEPPVDALAIRRSLAGILALAARRRARYLAMPLLGWLHGQFPPEGMVTILAQLLDEGRGGTLRAIWLQAVPHWDCAWLAPLDQASED